MVNVRPCIEHQAFRWFVKYRYCSSPLLLLLTVFVVIGTLVWCYNVVVPAYPNFATWWETDISAFGFGPGYYIFATGLKLETTDS